MGDADESSCSNKCSTYINPPIFKFTDATCGVCLDILKNRAFVNSCSHTFCLRCLLKWSKQKLECPLCKQSFCAVYFSVTSCHSYKQIPLKCLIEPIDWRCSGQLGFKNSQLGRLKKLLEFGNLLTRDSDTLAINKEKSIRRNPYFFRKSVYVNNYWALGDWTLGAWTLGGFSLKEWIKPECYVEKPEFLVHLFPWIYRELEVLLSDKEHLIDEAFNLVVSMLQIYEIYSSKCVNYLKPFLGEQAQHFLHELAHFIVSRTTMPYYDEMVKYSSVHFLREDAFREAVVNGPEEYEEFITLESDQKPVITKGIKRKRVTSLFPTVRYADIMALTPDGHGRDRTYASGEIGSGFVDTEKQTSRPQPEPNPNPVFSIWERDTTNLLSEYEHSNSELIAAALMCIRRHNVE